MIELRLPSITSPTPQGQLLQIRSYLHQLIPDLQYALETIEKTIEEKPQVAQETRKAVESVKVRELKNEQAFSVKTRFAKFIDGGTATQTFFIFGVIGMTAIQGIATINEAGVAQWIGTEGVIVTSLSGGRLAVSLPSISNDTITVISGNKFTL